MNMTKLAIKIQNAKPVLRIAHMATNNPSYYVEEAEIGHSKVSVSFFNENETDSEIETANIPTKDLIDFTNEFYRDFEDGWDAVNDVHVQERIQKADIGYLTENLKAVCTDFLNARKEAINA